MLLDNPFWLFCGLLLAQESYEIPSTSSGHGYAPTISD